MVWFGSIAKRTFLIFSCAINIENPMCQVTILGTGKRAVDKIEFLLSHCFHSVEDGVGEERNKAIT